MKTRKKGPGTMKKRLISMLLMFTLLISLFPVFPAAAEDSLSGSCGSDLSWSLSLETGTLTVSGSGEMQNYHVSEEDLAKLEKNLIEKSGVIPVAFAYPFGAYDEESEAIVKAHYDAIFTCYERINVLKKGEEKKLARLWRINRDGTMSTAEFFKKL